MKGKFTWLLLSCLMVLILILTSCGTKTTQTTPSTITTSTPGTTTTPSPTVQPSTTSPTYGGTLRIIMSGSPVSFFQPEANGPESWYEPVPCVENLVRFDEKGQAQPFLCDSFVEDPVAKTVTFKLRPNVKFHDGTIFDAQACKWNLDQLRVGQATGWAYPTVTSVDIVDNLTVRVNMSSWDSSFTFNMYLGSPMISPTAFEKNGHDWAADNPVGTGPFKFVSFQRDVNIVYEKFDDYWQKGKPYLDKIIINIINDPTTQILSLLKGDNDMIAMLNPTDAANLENNPNITVAKASIDGGTILSLIVDGAVPESPFYDIRVRQAAAYAIDRQVIVDRVYKGFAYADYQMGIPSNWSHSPNIVGYPYNPDKAKELLKEAGYPDGFETTIYCRTDKIYVDTMTAVQSYLAEVGIRAKLQPVELGKYNVMGWVEGWPTNGILLGGMIYDPELASCIYFGWMLEGGTALAREMVTPEQNTEIKSLYYQYIGATDFKTKQSLMWQIQSLIIDKYCVSPILLNDIPLAAKSIKIHGDYTCYLSPYTWTFADAWMEK